MKRVRNYIRYLLILTIVLSTFAVGTKSSYANILITPTLVTFEGRDRFAHVTLANTKNEARTYEIKWVFHKMVEGAGTYSEVDVSPTEFDLSKHIVFAPRRVTLPPNGTQRIKLGLRRPPEVADGDYHAHLRFTALPADEKPEEKLITEGKASASITITVSYSIPVIFRAGDVDDGATIGQIDLARDEKTGALNVNVPVTRKDGPYGVLGHLYVYNVVNGQEEFVGEISNANIFPEISMRTFAVRLKKEVSEGQLKVVFKHHDKDSDVVYAMRSFPLN